ncbi:RHS repeat-associated core domain-containing protein [Flavobacterium xanthum]|uniref:RHS repeat-associated core domain-containing protein n=1 Tax=Flavobacterium xanthum TaxID=69322 RepID=A0A1M7L9N3_9FLAO|nr:RHS repeat-associated core domain-containing protein [Flavobacterium xanthum]SHM74498.1 RHS repeat-associated core domain-containing protein [Flavobacterium xanthum]
MTGELKRVNIAQGAQGLDYVYTLGGQLKSINHPSLETAKDPGGDTNDLFGITLDYFQGDYLRTGNNITTSPSAGNDYNGNIKAARWANKNQMMDLQNSLIIQKGYLYNYNRDNWLTSATFGDTNASTAAISPTGKYKEAGLSYDPNGNIKTLQRSDNNATITDNLTYNYTNTGKNQLNYVTDAVTTADLTDIESQPSNNYLYDSIGQLIKNTQEDLTYVYNTQGLVIQVNKGTNPVIKMYYNERGQRIKKESFATGTSTLSSTDFYALDLSGNVMGVYNKLGNNSIVQTENPIFGLSRVGVYYRGGVKNYQITDHLGNVRAVIKKETSNGTTTMISYADYYPFGEQLPGRNSLSNYRYAFQGQELDKETGMEAFQLRLWDGRLGRWLSPDPYGEFHSPYLGMGNNPVSMIDPDGGCIKCPGDGKNHIDGMPGSGTSQQLNEIVIQGYKKPDGFFASGASAISTPDMFSFNGYNFGFKSENYNAKVSGYNADFSNNSSHLYVNGSAEITGMKGAISANAGNEMLGGNISAEGSVLGAFANGNLGVMTGQDNKFGVGVGAGAGAYAAKVGVKGGVALLGIKVNTGASVSFKSYHAGVHFNTYYDSNSGSLTVDASANLGLVVGVFLNGTFQLPIGHVIERVIF